MMQGKSSLNADAAPYTPISKNSSDGYSKSAKGVSEKSEGVGEAAIRQLHDSVSLEQTLKNLYAFDQPLSVRVQYYENSAAPYTPISKNSSDGDSKSAKGVSEKSEVVGEAAIHQLHDSVSLEQSLKKLSVSDKPLSVRVQYFENSVAEKQSMTDDTSIVIDFLMSRFPGYCAESLSEFLDFNNGDLEDTIDLLEEFETEHMDSPGTSEIRHASPSQNSDISRASGLR